MFIQTPDPAVRKRLSLKIIFLLTAIIIMMGIPPTIGSAARQPGMIPTSDTWPTWT